METIRGQRHPSRTGNVGPMGESSFNFDWRQKGTIQGRLLGMFLLMLQAPQKEGIYQFKIIYKKSGFNFVTLAERVTIRPYKHDQFERFLFVAYPYFFSVWSTIISTFAFVVIYLYSSWAESKQKSEWFWIRLCCLMIHGNANSSKLANLIDW